MIRGFILYFLSFALFFSGCSLADSARDLFYRDVARALEVAEKHGDERMQVCAAFIKQQLDWSKNILDEPTAGLISRTYRDYLAAIEARGQEARFEDACAPVVGKIAIKGMRSFGGVR
jgi:hypothetical protein